MPILSVWVLASITVMSAGLIQSLTGFGYGLVAVPFLLMLFPSRQAVLLSMALSLCSLVLQGVRLREQVNWVYVRQLVLIGLPALIGGLVIADFINPVILNGIVGITLLAYVPFQWIQAEKQQKLRPQGVNAIQALDSDKGAASDSKKGVAKPRGFYVAGITSGLLTGIAGLPGPPVVAVLVNCLPKEKFRATIIWFFIIDYIIAISIFLLLNQNGGWIKIVLWDILLYLGPTLLGLLGGIKIRPYLSEIYFKRLVFSLLLVVGISSSWDALKVLFL